jgi:hypothetical protein
MRELFGYTLQTLAPDENFTECEWFEPEPGTKGPTRRQRAKYATQGGLSDDYIAEIGVDVSMTVPGRTCVYLLMLSTALMFLAVQE